MGQYHKVVNATDNLYFDGRDLSTGVKLLEMGNSLTPTSALVTLLAPPTPQRKDVPGRQHHHTRSRHGIIVTMIELFDDLQS